MATGIFNFWNSYYYKSLKEVFGNNKNYQRWLEERKLETWNNWLISLGYRN